jgi:pimeloyl-ACP methyl ester carboxylesterase
MTVVVMSPPAIPMHYWEPLLESLSATFRFVFVHPRGLWSDRLPDDLGRVTVDDHAADLMAIVEELGFDVYGILAHCVGVAPVLRAINRIKVRPRCALLASARFGTGTVVRNLNQLLEQIRTQPGFKRQLARVLAAYAPQPLRAGLEARLCDDKELEAHLRFLQSIRAYAYDDEWPGDVDAVLVRSTNDPAAIRASTEAYALRLGDRCHESVVLEGGHFALQEDTEVSQQLVQRVFSERLSQVRA